jgi:hypothetical protein
MLQINFWKNWTNPYRNLWFVFSALFIFSLLFMWYCYFQGAAGVIHWEKIQEQKIIEISVHDFRLGPFELTIPAESYVIFEYLQGSELEHNLIASYVFLSILMVCAMMLLTVITTLERFWFFAGMSLFILFIVSIRLDVVLLFGQRGIAIPGAALFIFTGLSYYFKSIRPQTGFVARFLSFLSLSGIIAVVIHFFSEIPFPLMQLVVTSYIPVLILSVLFMIMVAHEILASFVYVTSQGQTKNLRHFSIISLIYMINLMITCLHEIGYIQWNFVYINLYLLISVSAILGLWGFQLRENLYQNIFSFSPFGAFFFIALGTICLITIAQLLGNANDAALKVMRDIIIFTHTAFGIVFLLYIVSNFVVMMADNYPVHKVLYNPNRMPYFTFRLAGVIVTLAFVFVSDWHDYVYHSTAGFYNYVGDYYFRQGNETYGKAFYDRSRSNAFQNHRANYALGMMKASRFDFDDADQNFELANGKRPSDFSLVNQGNLHLWVKKYFPAISYYRRAETIHTSPALSNNLGFAYAKVHNLDSAIYYISEARKHALTKSAAETNCFAIMAAEYLPVEIDSILKTFETNAPGVVSNALAAATLFQQNFSQPLNPLDDTTLDLHSATLLNNYIVRNARSLDTVFTAKAWKIASDSVNLEFSEALKASLAYAFYHQGNIFKAQQVLAELVFLTQSYRGKYNYILGLWALEQGSPETAHSYFSFAVLQDYKQARLYDAIALTESGNKAEAMIAWDSVYFGDVATEQAMAVAIKKVLVTPPAEALTFSDAEKYEYARYVVSLDDTVYFSRLINAFDDPNYKAKALLDMAKKQFRNDRIATAIRYFNQTSGLALKDKNLYDEILHFELLMLASRKETRTLAKQINKGITFDSTSRKLEKMLYTALVSESSGELETAEKNYHILGSWNPYFEDGILAAADFYRKRDTKSPIPYNILAEAIQINVFSIRLLKAYAEEAERQGFDEYAASAVNRLVELQQQRR